MSGRGRTERARRERTRGTLTSPAALLIVAACASTQPPPVASLPPCANSAAAPILLETPDVHIRGTYRIDMLYDAGEWIPATLMGGPLHHATHIELVNLPDFEPRLPHDRPSTFVVELLDHEVRQVTTGAESGRGGGFRSTYTATIVSICRTVEEQSPRRHAVDERE